MQKIEALKSVAEVNRGAIKFVRVDAGLKDNSRFMSSLGVVPKSLPTFRLTAYAEDIIKYKPSASEDEFSIENIENFISYFKAGDLKPYLNSQELPEDWNIGPVTVLVASNYERVTSDVSKTVFVKLFAPWCGHCKQVAPTWVKLGEHFSDSEGQKDVVIAEMDLSANQIETLKVNGFPTFRLYKAGSSETVDYTGPRNVEDFVKFVKENSEKLSKDEL